MLALACAQDGQVVFAGSYSNIWESEDGGQTWDQIVWPQPAPDQFGVPGAVGGWCVMDLAVAPDSVRWRVERDPRFLADITNNSRSDIVGFGETGVWTALSNGDGSFQGPHFAFADFGYEAGGWRVEKHPRFLADLANNGRADIVAFGDAGVWTALSNGDGTFQPPHFVVSDFGYEAGGWRIEKHPRMLADLTGNGRSDIIGFGDAGVWTALSNGDGSFQTPHFVLADLGYEAGGWRVERHPRFLTDLTNNGRADIVGFGDAGVWTALSNGDGSFQAPHFVVSDFGYEAGGWRIEKHPRILADLTGNGRADIVGFGDAGVWTALSNGDGTFQSPHFVVANFGYEAGSWRVEKHPRMLADLTGNGRADIIGFGDDGVWTALSNGDGTFQTPRFVLADFGYEAGSWRVEKHPRFVTDLTGNGRADIVGFGDAGVWVALGNGDGTFQAPRFVLAYFGYEYTVLAITRNDRESADKGIWRSTDGGRNWGQVHQFPSGEAVGQLVWAPGSDQLVYAAGGSSLAISKDGGATFQDVFPWGTGTARSVNHVAIGPSPRGAAAPAVVYALGNNIMFVSFDGGETWIQDQGMLPPGVGGPVGTANSRAPSVLVVSPRSPLEVFLVANDASLWRGDYSQIFSGAHASIWEPVVQPKLGSQDSGNVFVAATQQGHGNVLFYGPHRSTFYAAPLDPQSPSDWKELGGDDGVHVDLHGFFLSSDFEATFQDGDYRPLTGTAWLLSDGGIYRSSDGGKHFQAAQNVRTLSSVNVAGVALEGVGPALSLNTGDNDGFYSLDGGEHWASQQYGGGDNDCTYADPLTPNRILVFTPRWDGSVTLYKNDNAPGGLPDARKPSHQGHVIPGPPRGTGRPAWNAVSNFGLSGSRPIVLTKPGESAAGDGDYVFIRFKTDQQAVLLRTQKLLDIDSPNDWDTSATTASQGQRVFQQGPALPSSDLGVVQTSGGHANTVFYVGGNALLELWMWTEGMPNWKRLVPGNGATEARRFFVDPYRPSLIYILDQTDMKRSEDGGNTWQVDTSLQTQLTCDGRIPIERGEISGESDHFVEEVLTDMQFDPFMSLTRFAVGEGGAFYTNDGVNWNRLLDTGAFPGRPTNCYYDWVSKPCERSLYVAFAGRGLVKISPLPWGELQSPAPAAWSTNVKLDSQQSKSTPAVALFQNKMHMVRNAGGSDDLIWSTSIDGLGWDPGQTIPGQKSKAGASIAPFNGLLHMVHLGTSSNDIWWSTNDGTGWTENVKIPDQLSQTIPALVPFNGKLFMVHTGDSSHEIWVSTFDGNSWTKNTVIKGQLSKSPVKLAVFQNKIHMLHLGDSENDIWWSIFDPDPAPNGSWWSNTRIRCQRSQTVPALAVHNGLLHMVHQGDGSNSVWWSLYDGHEWTPNVTIPHQQSKTTPALCETPDHSSLVMLHLGDSSDDIWYSAM